MVPESRSGSGDKGPLSIILGYGTPLDSWEPLRVLSKGEASLDVLFGCVECGLREKTVCLWDCMCVVGDK